MPVMCLARHLHTVSAQCQLSVFKKIFLLVEINIEHWDEAMWSVAVHCGPGTKLFARDES